MSILRKKYAPLRPKATEAFCLLVFSMSATNVALAGGGAASQAFTTVQAIVVQGITLLVGLISVLAFVYIAYACISKFNDARRGRAEWAEVAIPFLAGAVLLVFVTWLVGEATTAVGLL